MMNMCILGIIVCFIINVIDARMLKLLGLATNANTVARYE